MAAESRLRLVEARRAAGDGDYLRAVEIHEDVLRGLAEGNPAEAVEFSNGPYQAVLLEAFQHAHVLARRCHHPAALELVRALRRRFEEFGAEEIVGYANGLEAHAMEGLLYTRASPRPHDVVICCHGADLDSLAEPLADALRELGVVVAEDPWTISADPADGSFSARVDESDVVVVIVSPSFLTGPWPRKELEDLLADVAVEPGRVLPAWHGVSRPAVLAASEPLERTLALDAGATDLATLARRVSDLVRPDLASGALDKAVWSGLLAQRPLAEALAASELPVRHEGLDPALVARIRLIRSAFLDGNRQTMRAWLDGFSRELDPYPAVVAWQALARAFLELRDLQRRVAAAENGSRSEREAFYRKLVPPDVDPGVRKELIGAYRELAAIRADRAVVLCWVLSHPVIHENLDLGFSPSVMALASFVRDAERPSFEAVDEFPETYSVDTEISVTEVGEEDREQWREGVLHQEEERPWSKEWDVFVSHASEDKGRVVRPLADALAGYGVRVWFDTFALKPGTSLGPSIDRGIESAEFGIVVLSPRFVAKEWPRYELEALRKRQTTGEGAGRLLALWHDLTREDGPDWVRELDPAGDLQAGTASITALAREVLGRVRPDLERFVQRRLRHEAFLDSQEAGTAPVARKRTSEINAGPRRYDRLPPELVDRVRLIRAALFEAHPHSMDYWLDGFLRDHNPEREIAHWEEVAAMYGEAVLVVDAIQKDAQGGLGRLLGRRPPTVGHEEVFGILNTLLHAPGDDTVSSLRERTPERVFNTIWNIVTSEEVIDVLDPE